MEQQEEKKFIYTYRGRDIETLADHELRDVLCEVMKTLVRERKMRQEDIEFFRIMNNAKP